MIYRETTALIPAQPFPGMRAVMLCDRGDITCNAFRSRSKALTVNYGVCDFGIIPKGSDEVTLSLI